LPCGVPCRIGLYEIKSAGLRPTLRGLSGSGRAASGRSLLRSPTTSRARCATPTVHPNPRRRAAWSVTYATPPAGPILRTPSARIKGAYGVAPRSTTP